MPWPCVNRREHHQTHNGTTFVHFQSKTLFVWFNQHDLICGFIEHPPTKIEIYLFCVEIISWTLHDKRDSTHKCWYMVKMCSSKISSHFTVWDLILRPLDWNWNDQCLFLRIQNSMNFAITLNAILIQMCTLIWSQINGIHTTKVNELMLFCHGMLVGIQFNQRNNKRKCCHYCWSALQK